ncbi:MAG: MTH1187 family thiamine-binding protein [Nitrospirae bacterium]|nr:MTH1187 family thiamine-binding protein [Nitrospirota bacterium]
MIAQFSVVPLGIGASASAHVAKVIRLIDESGLDYRMNPMGTVVEGEWDEVMGLIEKCHRLVLDDVERVLTTVTIDDRKGRTGRITGKVESVEKILGKTVKK